MSRVIDKSMAIIIADFLEGGIYLLVTNISNSIGQNLALMGRYSGCAVKIFNVPFSTLAVVSLIILKINRTLGS